MKPTGPVELLIVKFLGNRFTGELAPALLHLVEAGTVTVVDLLFIHKDEHGQVSAVELVDLPGDEAEAYAQAVTDVEGVLTEEDVVAFGSLLEDNSSAGVILFENTWAVTFAQAMRNANGDVLLNERIPSEVIDALSWDGNAA